MADKRGKVIIPKESLSAFSSADDAYLIRYRIVSKDSDRKSAWSNNELVSISMSNATVPEPGATVYNISISQASDTATVVWTPPPSLKTNTYDVYVNWSGAGWKYIAQVSATSFATNIAPAETTVQVAVQVPTYPKSRHTLATLFETAVTNV